MRVMIVDDEIIVCAGMKMLIPWNDLGFQVVGEASNAADAIELSKTLKPDLMLVDITMPGMNGLEMIECIQQELPECEFIVLTCHSEIQYLTRAIKLRVLDYLIKDSLNPEEIAKTLKKIAKQKCSNARLSTNGVIIQSEAVFLEAIEGSNILTRELFKAYNILVEDNFLCFSLVFQLKKFADISLAVRISEEMVRQAASKYHFCCNGSRIFFLIAAPKTLFLQKVILHRCMQTLAQSFDVQIAGGASECCSLDMPVFNVFSQAICALQMFRVHGWQHSFIFNSELDSQNKARLIKIRSNIEAVYSLNQFSIIYNYLEELNSFITEEAFVNYDSVKHLFADFAFFINDLINNDNLSSSIFFDDKYLFPNELFDMYEYKEIYELYQDKLTNIFEQVSFANESDTIKSIKNYIAQHIEDKILLQNISDAVHLSRTYVSTVFKKKTGKNIGDYILGEKLYRAKNLLLSGMSVNMVAENIGMQSESYFIKLFKESFNETPSHFAKNVNNKNN